MFNDTLHIVPIPKPKKKKKIMANAKLNDIEERTEYENITVDVKTGNDIQYLMEESISEKGADRLAMFSKIRVLKTV